MPDGFKIAEAYVEVHAKDDAVQRAVRDIPRKVAPDARKAGQDVGDKVAKGLGEKLSGISPLVRAAIGGGLALGAPAALAGATALFGGIAAAALSQNERVKASFTGLGVHIKAAAAEDAAVLVPTFERTAGRIGDAFDKLRPRMRDTFAGVAPQVDDLTTGLLSLADHGITGASRAALAAGPAMHGLSTLLDHLGVGLEGFFTNLTTGSTGGGRSLAALGDVVQALLPVVGQALGTFGQLSGDVLPALAEIVVDVAHGFGDFLHFIEPLVPALGAVTSVILTGTTALKGYKLASGAISSLADSLAGAGSRVGEFTGKVAGSASAGTRLGGVLSKVGSALPLVGLAVAGVAVAYGELGSKAEESAAAVLNGSMSLQSAFNAERNQIEKRNALMDESTQEGYAQGEAIGVLTGQITEEGIAQEKAAKAAQADAQARQNVLGQMREQLDKLPPLQRAHAEVTLQQNLYTDAVQRFGEKSPEATAAADALAQASQRAKDKEQQAADAAKSWSDRLSELSETIQGAIGASLSLEEAENRTRDAAKAAGEAIKEHGRKSTEARDANLGLRQAVEGEAEAAGRQAEAANKSKGETEAARLGAEAYRQKLMDLAHDSDGRVRAAALSNIDRLSDTELKALDAANRTSGLHTEMVTLPSGRTINITTPGMDEARQNVRGLSEEIRNINGKTVSIFVSGTGKDAQKGGIASAGRFATGGPVRGPGSGTSDTAGLFALSNNEHVWTAAEVDAAGGHREVERLRKMVLTQGRGMAAGGPVVALNTRYTYSGSPPNSIFASLGQRYMSSLGGGGTFTGTGGRGYIIQHESGGNPRAKNPTSTASGLYQMINGTWKAYGGSTPTAAMASVAEQNAVADRYVASRYGSWDNAARFWAAHHWYDQGGIAAGPGMMMKGTAEPERVLSPDQTRAFERLVDHLTAGGGAMGDRPVVVNVMQTSGSPAETGRFVSLALRSA